MLDIIYEDIVKRDDDKLLSPLSENEIKVLKKLINNINSISTIVYRGASKNVALSGFLNSDAMHRNLADAADKLFFFGEKAIHTLKDNFKYLQDLNTVELDDLISLSNCVSEVLNHDSRGYEAFDTGNSEFLEVFSNEPVYRLRIHNTFNELDIDQKFAVRNMLISFLHTHGKNEYKPESSLVSTSELWSIASENADSEGVIFIYFIPEPFSNYAIKSNSASQYSRLLASTNIPCIDSPLHEDEHEIYVIGAMFPRFIIGYYDKSEKHFVVNHHIFNDDNCERFAAIPRHGINFDQSNFDEKIKDDTHYKNHVEIQSEIVTSSK